MREKPKISRLLKNVPIFWDINAQLFLKKYLILIKI